MIEAIEWALFRAAVRMGHETARRHKVSFSEYFGDCGPCVTISRGAIERNLREDYPKATPEQIRQAMRDALYP